MILWLYTMIIVLDNVNIKAESTDDSKVQI